MIKKSLSLGLFVVVLMLLASCSKKEELDVRNSVDPNYRYEVVKVYEGETKIQDNQGRLVSVEGLIEDVVGKIKFVENK